MLFTEFLGDEFVAAIFCSKVDFSFVFKSILAVFLSARELQNESVSQF